MRFNLIVYSTRIRLRTVDVVNPFSKTEPVLSSLRIGIEENRVPEENWQT
jgi:hypothetical protein